jgi:hypothetical protein
MSEPETIYDFIILGLPDDADLDDPEVIKKLDAMAHRSVMGQYKRGMPKAVLLEAIEWWMTSDWRDVEARQPDHDCPSCRAGNDQAIAYLKEHPTKRLALGNLRYVEVW